MPTVFHVQLMELNVLAKMDHYGMINILNVKLIVKLDQSKIIIVTLVTLMT